MSIELRRLPVNIMARASLMVTMSLLKMSFLMEWAISPVRLNILCIQIPTGRRCPAANGNMREKKTVALGVLLDPVVDRRAVTFSIPTEKLDNNTGYAKLTYSTAVKRSVVDTSKNLGELTNSASASSGDKVFKAGSDI